MGKENLISKKSNKPWTKVPIEKEKNGNAGSKATTKTGSDKRQSDEKRSRNSTRKSINEDAYPD